MFAPGDFYLELMPTPTPEQETLNGELVRMAQEARHPARRDQRLPLRQPQRRRRARRADGDPDRQEPQGREAAQARRRQLLHEVAGRDGRRVQGRAARRSRTPRRSRQRCNVKLKLDQTLPAALQGPRRRDARQLHRASIIDKGLERRFGELAARGVAFDPDEYRERSRRELERDPEDGVLGLLPDRLGLHQLGEGARHPGRAGPRLGRRLARRVRDADHRPRSDRVQAAVRALPEPRARVDAGLRRRLLHGPARRGHRVRPGEVRRGPASARSRRSTSSRRAA